MKKANTIVTQKIGFEVVNLGDARKPGYIWADVKFDDNSETYHYVRKAYVGKSADQMITLIDGVEVTYNKFTKEVISYERYKDTKGMKKTNTSNLGNKRKSKVDQMVEEVEEVIENGQIEIEEPAAFIPSNIVKHDKFDMIKSCVENYIPVYLVGPAGAGKNHTLEQISEELEIEFYFTNSVQQEYQLTGFVDAGGNYHDTQFYRACKNADEGKETMFFLDEIDASIPEVLVKLNMAIAQGYFEFPNGEVLKFKNHIHWVSAGNTFGNGADEMYSGRMVLDSASLDRFVVIDFDYCLNIEMSLTKGNTELVNFIRQLRKITTEQGIRSTFSYRCLMNVTKLEKAMPTKTVLEIAVFKGMDKDTLNTIYVPGSSKYHKAFQEMKMAC